MGRKKRTALEATEELAFIESGRLNTVILKTTDEWVRIAVDSAGFLEDPRLVRNSNMDQINFQKDCTFKVTLDFVEPMTCIEETAVRESTDWTLCACRGNHAFYSKVEQRLILQECTVSLQSNIRELTTPFTLVLLLDDDEWVVERVVR